MIVQMKPGIKADDSRTFMVAQAANDLGVKAQIKSTGGKDTSVVEVYLIDDNVKACTLTEHGFRQMPGVDHVIRVTPSTVSLSVNGSVSAHHIKLGSATVGNDLPCQLVAGPCTVDNRIDQIVDELVNVHGIKMIRGGCWKPRSNAESFPGFGKKGVRWLLKAADKHKVEVVFIEVIDETHIQDIAQIRNDVGFEGKIVLWVGARTENQILFRRLGRQKEFPVMLKNPIRAKTVAEWMKRAEFVVTGERHFDDKGILIPDRSLEQGNEEIMMCSRGVEQDDEESPYRFSPRHEWIATVRNRYWTTVGVDPSHSAGTMQNDLVFTNLEAALIQKPAFVLLETYLTDLSGMCDAQQAVPHNRLPEVQEMIAKHNQRHYPSQ